VKFLPTVPPARHPEAFGAQLSSWTKAYRIDCIVPTCEEIFWLAGLNLSARIFSQPLEQLAQLHHKFHFTLIAQQHGLKTPGTLLVNSPEAGIAASREFPNWVAKPAFSRFGQRTILGSHQTAWNRFTPSPDRPWVIQEFIAGQELSTYSLFAHGRLLAHVAYSCPVRSRHGAGTKFASLPPDSTLRLVEALGRGIDYTGQLAFDWIQSEHELYAIDCNPRATSGVHLIPRRVLASALLDTGQSCWVTPAGIVRQLTLGALIQTWNHPAKIGGVLKDAFTGAEVLYTLTDPGPWFGAFISLGHFTYVALRQKISLNEAITADIEWNGQPIQTIPSAS
jgi:hypothetical protein